jgi:DNA-binding response OmpR family regulator
VKSQVNKGTEFEVILPIHHLAAIVARTASPCYTQIADIKLEGEQLPIPVEVSTNALDEAPLSINEEISTDKPLVLIADDNADVRTYIASCLGTDYNIILAKDGQECETLAFEQTPDIIVSDVMMPFKDGFEVCKTLKSDERTSHIPIIMLTAKADIKSKLQGLEQGADVYLMKPFHKEELLLRIKKLLELRLQLQLFYRSTIGSNTAYTVTPSRDEAESIKEGKTQVENISTEKPNPLVNNADNAFVLKVKTLIEANLNNAGFDVEKLCRDLLLSPSQVHRKLTALTGLSTNNFIRYIRLVKAKEGLVKNARFSIAAVAYDCGFNDPAYFSRAFKQEFSVTPQVWREENL